MKKLFILLALICCVTIGCKKADTPATTDTTPAAESTDTADDSAADDTSADTDETN